MFRRPRHIEVEHLHQPGGWLSPGHLVVDENGCIAEVADRPPKGFDRSAALHLRGFALPGMPDLHSHAFQRALVGRGEVVAPGRDDSFWTWREAMYRVASLVTPDDLGALAAQLYVELLEGGFTSVGEFHYLHHDPGGHPYDDPALMGLSILDAAEHTGMALTLLPVLYRRGGFDRPAEAAQRRFVSDGVDAFLDLFARLESAAEPLREAKVGVAPHSLRAVAGDELVALASAVSDDTPVHLHVAEQEEEVRAALEHLGARPVAWVLDRLPVSGAWCLVHATHVDDDERRRLAGSGAVAGLCPSTEANLGDGVFPAADYARDGGRFGVGTDSHVSVSAANELMLLEYGQRLVHARRNLLAGRGGVDAHVGRFVYDRAAEGGARALARPAGRLEPGRRADLVVLSPDHPRLAGHGPDTVLDAYVLGGAASAVSDVFVAGRHVVHEGRHLRAEPVRARFRTVMRRIAAAL